MPPIYLKALPKNQKVYSLTSGLRSISEKIETFQNEGENLLQNTGRLRMGSDIKVSTVSRLREAKVVRSVCESNLVPGAFPLKNGWGKKRGRFPNFPPHTFFKGKALGTRLSLRALASYQCAGAPNVNFRKISVRKTI